MGDEEKALAEKQLGNDAYKKKDFEAAIAHYSKVGMGTHNFGTVHNWNIGTKLLFLGMFFK